MTQYDRYVLGTMFKILARLLFLVVSQVVLVRGTPDDMALKILIESDYAIFVERVDLWRDEK